MAPIMNLLQRPGSPSPNTVTGNERHSILTPKMSVCAKEMG